MNLAEFAIRQRTFFLFFITLCIVAGGLSYFKLGKLEDPTFTVKSAVVVTLYPGASAQEVEAQVTDVIETKLQQMGALKELRSLSKPGMSMIFIDLEESVRSAEVPQQWDLLRRKVNDVKLSLPASAQISIIQDEFSEVYGMLFSVYGKDVAPIKLREYAKELQRRLKTVKGIKIIELHGVREQAVNIDLNDEHLANYQLSTLQVINQLNTQNMIFDAGTISAQDESIRINQRSEFQSVEDIKNFMLKGGVSHLGTGLIRLGDIADVYVDYQKPALTMSRYNGLDAVTLAVSPSDGINVVSLGDTINEVLAQYQAQLPVGVEIGTVAFQPYEVQKSIDNFVGNIIESILIVVLVLWLFMGLKSAAIVGSSLIVTILLTLIFMYATGIDLQRVSLGTFILALGMLVDNAIVITDMFVSKINKGMERFEAARSSVQETVSPLLFATIIAVLGTSPILFSNSDAAEFAISVFYIMCASLLLSWFVAMTLTPLLCWLWIKPKKTQQTKPNKLMAYLTNVIHWTVDFPKRTLALLVPLLLITAVFVNLIAVNFMPSSDRPMVFVDYWLPNGAQIERTEADMQRIEAWLLEQPEVINIASFIGASAPRFSVTVEPEPLDPSYGQIVVNTIDHQSIEALVTRGDKWLAMQFPQAEPRFRSLKLATKDKFTLEARFMGPDPEVLKRLSREAELVFAAHPNTKYARNDWRQTSKVLTPIINQDKARRAGVNRADIAMSMRRATQGVPLGIMREDDRMLPISLKRQHSDMSSLENIQVKSMLGLHGVPLGQVIDGFELTQEDSMLWRRDRLPAITAQAATFGRTASEVRLELADDIEAIIIPDGYRFEWGGEYRDERISLMDTFSNLPKAIILMTIILVAMFNGFKQPLIIMFTVPLAATGASISLVLFDKPFGYMALIGAIALSGMIIKNGIVLMDQIELERKSGLNLGDAIKKATLNRTMAISMGALTTALGMIPLLSDPLFDQMAATIIGGLVAATFLSLLVMPALYKLSYQNSDNKALAAADLSKEITHES
ncbi:transporter [Psychromonas marina]|uniref:Transporter n=1 Tax=Psychromonas marina TaxID=88364 RepID=A0ABQ6E4H4_9GAMM|nr:efflux RND transporter permease subunit [Psychromonas marina]GLS92105.1 transporter [Psychromonas marina]